MTYPTQPQPLRYEVETCTLQVTDPKAPRVTGEWLPAYSSPHRASAIRFALIVEEFPVRARIREVFL